MKADDERAGSGSRRLADIWGREIILWFLIAIYGAVSIVAYTDYPTKDTRP